MFVDRKGIVVWMRVLSNLKYLHRYGHVHYISKRFKYAILYCNVDEVQSVGDKLLKLKNVTKIELSNIGEMREYFQTE